MKDFNVILFHDFESLDVFGPVEVMGKLNQHYSIEFYSEQGGLVTSSQNVKVQTLPITELSRLNELDVLLIPGGIGTILKDRKATTNKMAFDRVANLDQEVQWIRKAKGMGYRRQILHFIRCIRRH